MSAEPAQRDPWWRWLIDYVSSLAFFIGLLLLPLVLPTIYLVARYYLEWN